MSAPKGLKTVTDFIFSVDISGKVTIHSALTSGKVEYKDGKLIVTDDREVVLGKPISPTPPASQEKSKTPNIPKIELPKTGDGVNPTLYAILLGLSGIALILIEIKRKNNAKKKL